MEDALQRLMKESASTKYASVATAAHKALGEKCDCENPHITVSFTNVFHFILGVRVW